MRTPTRLTVRRALYGPVLGALAAAVLASSGPVTARDKGHVNPLTRHFASLQVGPGHEFRMLTVHPLQASAEAAAPEDARLVPFENPDTIGLALPSPGRTRPLYFDNLDEGREVLLPGYLVRSDTLDFMVTGHTVVPTRSRVELPLAQASAEAPDDEPRPERAVLRQFPPPTLRWTLMGDIKAAAAREAVAKWAEVAELEAGRHSAADLSTAALIRDRVAEYQEALGTLARAPIGLQNVGYAAVLDGTPLVIETFGDGEFFGKSWPGLLRGLAVEASVAEVNEQLLDQDIPPSGEPDRFLAAVRASLLSFFGEKPDVSSTRKNGQTYRVETAKGDLHGLVLDRTVLVHAVMITDPRRRGGTDDEDFDPGVISRKARPTEAEKRWLDRRNRRNPPVPPPVPPPSGE